MYYTCKHFQIEELVPPEIFGQFGERSWMFFNPMILISIDNVREYFSAPATVNTWLWGGYLKNRGLRRPNCTEGAKYSIHKFGGAFDYDVEGYTAEEVRNVILLKKDEDLFTHITCLEDDVSWVHMDCRNIKDRILLFKP